MAIDLTELFEVQRKLDAEIERKHPIAPGEDRLAKRILALQVELGELANEWRGFKFWSMDQEPVIRKTEHDFFSDEVVREYNPLLEEYVDCLHFILSIGIDLNIEPVSVKPFVHQESITEHFIYTVGGVGSLVWLRTNESYCNSLEHLLGLGEMLGFTWEQVTEAYMNKNKVNWERQANGY